MKFIVDDVFKMDAKKTARSAVRRAFTRALNSLNLLLKTQPLVKQDVLATFQLLEEKWRELDELNAQIFYLLISAESSENDLMPSVKL